MQHLPDDQLVLLGIASRGAIDPRSLNRVRGALFRGEVASDELKASLLSYLNQAGEPLE